MQLKYPDFHKISSCRRLLYFMVIAACYAHGEAIIYYLIVFCVIMAIGMMLMSSKKK